MLRADRIIFLIFSFVLRILSVRLVRSRVTATSKVLRGTLLIFINNTLMFSSTSRVVEGLSKKVKSLFLKSHDLLFLIEGFFSFFGLDTLFAFSV